VTFIVKISSAAGWVVWKFCLLRSKLFYCLRIRNRRGITAE